MTTAWDLEYTWVVAQEALVLDAEEPEPEATKSGAAKYCEDCEVWLSGPTQWEDHKIGKQHRHNVKKGNKATPNSSLKRSVTMPLRTITENPDEDGEASRTSDGLMLAPNDFTAYKEYTRRCHIMPLFAGLWFRVCSPTFRRNILLTAVSVLHFGLVRINKMVGGNNSHLQRCGLYPCWESVHDIN